MNIHSYESNLSLFVIIGSVTILRHFDAPIGALNININYINTIYIFPYNFPYEQIYHP